MAASAGRETEPRAATETLRSLWMTPLNLHTGLVASAISSEPGASGPMLPGDRLPITKPKRLINFPCQPAARSLVWATD